MSILKKIFLNRVFLAAIFILVLFCLFLANIRYCVIPRDFSAKSDMNAIVTSIKQYEATYGIFPWDSSVDRNFGEWNKDKYDTLMEILTCYDGPDSDSKATANERNIKFLDIEEDFQKKSYLDPWGKRYKIFIDLDHDGKIRLNGRDVEHSVIVYSFGKNGKDENGEGDDVTSF